MSGFYKKAVVWLGLNEEYPDDAIDMDSSDGTETPSAESDVAATPAPSRARPVGPDRPAQAPRSEARPSREQRNDNPLGHNATRDRSEGTVRAIPLDDSAPSSSSSIGRPSDAKNPSTEASSGTVRAVPMPATTKPQVIIPQSFNDAQDVADMFRDAKPVIVNMQNAERDLARRLIDFSSGLCYGLGGQMEKVARDVYLLTPTDVEVADEDRGHYS